MNYILTPTRSGYTTCVVSKYKPKAPIIAFTQNDTVARHLNLRWGVYPISGTPWLDIFQMIDYSSASALEKGFVKNNGINLSDTIIKRDRKRISEVSSEKAFWS